MTHKSGSVKMPFKYRAWCAEIYGNTEDTGGFYVTARVALQQLLYPVTDVTIINNFIIGDTHRLH